MMASLEKNPTDTVKILWGYLQWYDISSELIPSEFWEIHHF